VVAAFATPLLAARNPRLRAFWVGLFMTLTSLTALVLAWRVFHSGPAVYVFGAAAPRLALPADAGGIPVRILFEVDALGALMATIVALVSWAITIYSLAAESRQSGLEGFYALLFLLVAGIYGLVCTGDLFNFFVFFEITSLAGSALVAYRVDKGVAVEAGFKYALLSTLAGLFVLLAVGILYGQYNALNLAELARRIQSTNLDKIALVLLIVPLAMKCGAVPMHFWTPDAYTTAPSSVTALLVVSSQASLYGLFRVLFSLYGHALNAVSVGWFVIILGVLSMFIGVTMAIPQKDIKRLMAYHAVSQTGYMLLGVGVGLAVLGDAARLEAFGRMAMAGGIFHIINHAMYKGLLFLTAGVIFYRCGTRNLNRLGGLGHKMTWTMIFFIIGALAIAGIPPFNGFASKLMLYESVFRFNPFLAVIAMVVSILTLASFVKVFHSVFMGPPQPAFATAGEAPRPMLLGMGVLAGVVILFGLFPQAAVERLILPAVDALLGQARYMAAIVGGL